MIRPPHALIAAVAAAGTLTLGHAAYAQHSDVDFAFENDRIEVEFGPEGQVFEGEFPTSGSFEQFTDDPGFAQEDGTAAFPTGTNIDYNILGPLVYHDGSGFASVPTGVQIKIDDNPNGSLTVTDATASPLSGPGVIGDANGGHAHIDFTLQPGESDTGNNPPAGAYGLLMELIAVQDNGNLDPVTGVGNSDPFYIVFNFGLEGEDFEGAVGDFAELIPEPASLALVGLGGLMILTRRRRDEGRQRA